MTNTNIGFTVKRIEKAQKAGYVVVFISFDSNPNKEFNYIRRTINNTVYIDNCRIEYNNLFEVINITREKDSNGKVKKSNIKTTSEKIKTELEGKDIKVPEIKTIPQIKEEGPVKHEQYETIKNCLECGIPIYLAGPAGSGKNFTVEQIANELGWNFYFSNSVQQEYKLTGFIDAGGKFHETEFSKACKEAAEGNDVVFFLDEMDASIPEVLVLLNAAIANGYFEFPDGKINFSEKVHFVAAGNTVGSGADDMYTGRMVLDQATLDRFAIIEFNYSLRIEMSITNNNSDLVGFIHQMRDEADKKGVRATFSYRCMTMVTKLEKTGMDLETAMKIAVVKGLDKDTINTLNPVGSTKYHEALKGLQAA